MKTTKTLLVLLILTAVVTAVVAVERQSPPDTNCQIIDDDYGICDSDQIPDKSAVINLSEDEMSASLNKSMAENPGLYDDLEFDPEQDEIEGPTATRITTTTNSPTTNTSIISHEPTKPTLARSKRQPSTVSLCGEWCYNYRPWYVYRYHRWWRVVQTPWFRQYIRWCYCTNPYCSGRAARGWFWHGRCNKERAWKKLLVWDRFWWCLRWIWVKYDHGCCCVLAVSAPG